jgi:hypothetical protein
MPTVETEVLCPGDVPGGQDLAIAQPGGADPLEEAENRLVGLGTVRHQQVGVVGRPQIAVGDDAEATDHHEGETGCVGVGDDAV